MDLKIYLAFSFLIVVHRLVDGQTSPPPDTTNGPPAPDTGTVEPGSLIGLAPPGAPDINACGDKNPCPDKNSRCIDGNCICNDGYAQVENSTCLKTPGLGDPCRVGQQEFYCSGFGVDVICPNVSGGVCDCRPGYEPDTKESCKPALRAVGASCKVDGDCTVAFTSCESGKCACIEGFKPTEKDGLCTPTDYKCLNGDKPKEEKGSVVFCNLSVNPASGDIGNDSCSEGYFCHNWQNSVSANRTLVGHCCPIPKDDTNVTVTCPIGLPHKTGLCPDFSMLPADAPIPADIGPLCPLGQGYECFRGRICCPLACRSSNSHFNVDGKCYDSVILDQPCEINAQCLPNSSCTKGTCQCDPGTKNITSTFCLPNGEDNPFGTR